MTTLNSINDRLSTLEQKVETIIKNQSTIQEKSRTQEPNHPSSPLYVFYFRERCLNLNDNNFNLFRFMLYGFSNHLHCNEIYIDTN